MLITGHNAVYRALFCWDSPRLLLVSYQLIFFKGSELFSSIFSQMFCSITSQGLLHGLKPTYDPTCIFEWWKNLPRVRSTKYTQNLYHLSGKTIPNVLELLPRSEHHKPFGFSPLILQEHLNLNKHSKSAAGFIVVWHGHNSLLSSRELVIIYIIKYMKGDKNDREIPEPLRNPWALPCLTLGCPALPGPASWPITPNSWMQEVVEVLVEGEKGILRRCEVPKPIFILLTQTDQQVW